jgi:predicted transcriptional regulator
MNHRIRDDAVKAVARLVQERRVSAAPVVDGDGRVVGVTSDSFVTEEFCHIPTPAVPAHRRQGG